TAGGSTTWLEFDSVEPGGGACGPAIDDGSVGSAKDAHWYSNAKRVMEGTALATTTKGTLTLHPASGTGQTKCKLKDAEIITNPIEGGAGTDELTEFVLSGCKAKPSPCPAQGKLEILAHKLPWLTHLIAGPPTRDVIEGVELEVKCNGI